MISISDLIKTEKICEEFDYENLLWKLNFWYSKNDQELENFYSMMKFLTTSKPIVNIQDIKKLLQEYNISYNDFVNFVMDNVDGLEEFDSLYIMKKILDILKSNKNLNWDLPHNS